MTQNTGTYDINHLLESEFFTTSAKDYGFERIQQIIEQDITYLNQSTVEMLSTFAFQTMKKGDYSGSSTNVRGQEVDEYGQGHTDIVTVGGRVEYPMRRFVYPHGENRRWLKLATVADVLMKYGEVIKANRKDTQSQLKKALYTSTNYNFRDIQTAGKETLEIKQFLNADGSPIPDSPQDGTVFDPDTHTHYTFGATLDAALAQGLIDNVSEHSQSPNMQVYINSADASKWEALAGFRPTLVVQSVYRDTAAPDVPTTPRPRNETRNYMLGEFGIAHVWIKPWALADYSFCFDMNAPTPVAFRIDEGASGALENVQDLRINELQTHYQEALMGFAASERTNGAALYHNSGVSYIDPTIS